MQNVSNGTMYRSVIIDTDLSSKQNTFVAYDATDDDVVNAKADGTSQSAFVLVDDGNGATTPVTGSIAIVGVVNVKIGNTVTAGDYLMPTTGGVAIPATDGNYFSGKALKGGVNGDIIPMLVVHGYLETT